jgi:hypothetical protein
MRISSESLDLDDIISDLNSQTSKKPVQECSEKLTKPETKKVSNPKPLAKVGKENDSRASNKVETVAKPKPLQEMSHTTDTKAATTDKESKRYAASECEMSHPDHEEEPLRLQ